MFLNDDDIEQTTLRQGDIVKNIHLLGALNLNNIHYSSTAGSSDPVAWNIPNVPNYGDAMIVSHSCEIAQENSIKVTSIILAPLRDVNKATAPGRIKELIDSNRIDQTNPTASFLKYFFLEANPKLKYRDGVIVDFSKIFSVRNKSYDMLLKQKVAQLKGPIVSSMALKLALYFHRQGLLAA